MTSASTVTIYHLILKLGQLKKRNLCERTQTSTDQVLYSRLFFLLNKNNKSK